MVGVTGSCVEFEVSGLSSMGCGGARFSTTYEKLSCSCISQHRYSSSIGKGAEGCAGSFVVFAGMVEGFGDQSCVLGEAGTSAEVGVLWACLL